MPVTVIPENPDDEWSLAEWLEFVDDRKMGTATMSNQDMSAVERILVPYRKVRSCLRQMLGYSLSDNANFLLLRPEVPVNHPTFRWLWSDSASSQPLWPMGNPDEPKLDESDDPVPGIYLPRRTSDSFLNYGPDYTSNYGSAAVAVQFRHYPWVVWADWDTSWEEFVGEEWRRMCVLSEMMPSVDLITADGTDTGRLIFAEYNAAFPEGGVNPKVGPSGTAFPGGVHVRVQSTRFTVCWRGVEEQYLTGAYPDDVTDGLVMPNLKRLNALLGYVNSSSIFGHPRHTILFDGYRTVRYPFPVRTNHDFGLLGHDVYLHFKQTDPLRPANVKTVGGAAVADADRKRGHLVFPFRPSKSDNTASHYWLAATSGSTGAGGTAGTYGGSAILGEWDLTELFRHADDPAYPLPT